MNTNECISLRHLKAWERWVNICFPELVKKAFVRRLTPSACVKRWGSSRLGYGEAFWYQGHLKLIQLASQPFLSDSSTFPSHIGKPASGVLVRSTMLCNPWVYVGKSKTINLINSICFADTVKINETLTKCL